MKHILVQEFLRIEAVGSQVGTVQINSRGGGRDQRADPVALNVVLTDDADPARELDNLTLSNHLSRLYRVVTGVWAYEVPSALLQPAHQYTVRFRYQMAAGALNVVRQSFQWDLQPVARNGGCILHGVLTDVQGLPVANQKLVVEQYADMATLNHRTSTQTVHTDPFGLWWIELPKAALVRVVFGDVSKVIVVPNTDAVALKDVPPAQLEGIRTDPFGYPMP